MEIFRHHTFLICIALATGYENLLFVPIQTRPYALESGSLHTRKERIAPKIVFRTPTLRSRTDMSANKNSQDLAEMDGIRVVKSASTSHENAQSSEFLKQDLAHGKAKKIQFDSKLLLEFERNGHVAIPSLFSHLTDLTIGLSDIQRAFDDELNTNLKQAYQQKMRLFAEDDDDEELLAASKRCKTASEAKAVLDAWCRENDCPVPFLQLFNMHRGDSPAARAFLALATSPAMGRIAADLLGVDGVRLYQTSAFFKVPVPPSSATPPAPHVRES
jgi:hypothetical protein